MNQTENKNKTSPENLSVFSLKVGDILIGTRKLGWLCLLLSILFGAIAFAGEYFRFVPRYTAETTFTVSTQNNSSSIGGVSVYSFYYDTATANQLTETFPLILNSKLLQNAVCEDLDLNYMPASLQAKAVEGSNMFTIYSTSTDPQLSYDVLASTIENYPKIAKYAVGNIKIEMITAPTVPTEPSNSTDYINTVLVAMAIGLGLGCFVIAIYAYSRNTVKTKNDIKSNLDCDVLGVIPKGSFKKHTRDFDRSILCTNQKLDKGFYSSIRILRNVIKNSLTEDEKIIIGTSTAPGEGKTTVITNLALSLVEKEKKILLVDGDVRRLSVAPLLGIDPEALDYNIITDDYKIAYLKEYGIYFMLFNTNDKGYFKYMNSSYAKSIFDSIRDKFDLILVDTPPCGLVSDALFFAQVADAAYYVVLQDTVRISKIQSGFNNLLSTDIKILGCVLNGAGVTHSRYGYGYHSYGYGYGYGYGSEYGYGYNKKKKHRR